MALAPLPLFRAIEKAGADTGDLPLTADIPWSTSEEAVESRAAFADLVTGLADRLWAAGLRHGDRLALVKQDHIDIQGVLAAAMRLGVVPAPLSSRMLPEELVDCVRRLDRPYLLLDGVAATRFAGERARLAELSRRMLALEPVHPEWLEPMQERAPHVTKPRPDDELALVTHSSGTTGMPKLVGHTIASVFVHAEPTIVIGRALGSSGTSLRSISFSHVRAHSALLAVLELGLPLVAVSDPRPDNVREMLVRHRPTSVEAHPNLLLRWERLADDPDRPFASVSRFISTFDAIHPRTVRRLLAASDDPNAVYLQGFGQTETGPVVIGQRRLQDLDTVSPRVVGRPLKGVTEVRIVGERNEVLPPGRVGQI